VSYWFRNDNRLPQARLAVASYVIVGMIGVLLIGFWKLQVIDADKYSSMAERNRVRYIPVIAPRGRMLTAMAACWWIIGRPSACCSFATNRLRSKSISRPSRMAWESPWMICATSSTIQKPSEISAHHHQA